MMSKDKSNKEIFRQRAFHKMIDRGIKDVREGRTISNEEMKQRIKSWSNEE